MKKPLTAFFLASLALCFFQLTALALASPDLDGGLLGFTTTGVVVGTPGCRVVVPFSPTASANQARIDMDMLEGHQAATIYMPVDTPISHDLAYYGSPLQPVVTPQPTVPAFMQKLDARIKKLRALSDKVSRIINPRIKTRTFDIQFQLQGLVHR